MSDASKIGSQTKVFCESLLKVDKRTGNKQIRGVLSLTKKHSSTLIEKAAIQSVDRGVLSLRVFRRLVEELAPSIDKIPKPLNLTQEHDLIRPPSVYAMYWDLHANKETQYH